MIEMRERVTVRPYAGQGQHGAIYGDLRTERCYIEPKRTRVTTATGEERTGSLWAAFGSRSTISTNDEVEWNGERYEVIDAEPLRDGGKTHHVECVLAIKVG